jgi:hypothetical protein
METFTLAVDGFALAAVVAIFIYVKPVRDADHGRCRNARMNYSKLGNILLLLSSQKIQES